ncbi:hypothetical protein CIB84_009294, partial [Bambusicola thoracicus]
SAVCGIDVIFLQFAYFKYQSLTKGVLLEMPSLWVGNRVPGNFKHAAPTLSISEPSDMPRRTPKKPLMTAEVN